ncbi:aminoglycoside phosphotransferase family protein [Amorphoplanes nipponensis]|uniref:Phosphotransferase n=1 Tax=Actinoplanes nipponensis TaxID=135950 RepID=A0A919JJI5_9ACTN|nr:aminoglycoside phosphotransferase family protein [Actinoplanes nipponensis]GIE50612.1 phosphotransferase [Actinoplanes nipponensis]
MHADQVDVSAAGVAALIAAQFPHWRDRPVRPLASAGTVNALFRLGDDLVLRFPLRPSAAAGRRDELAGVQEQARRLAAELPCAIPEPVALGAPGPDYPGWWSVYRWIPGETAGGPGLDAVPFARDLAGFVAALHGTDTGGRRWDGVSRGGPLATRDADVRGALAASTHLIDTAGLARIWARCRDAAPATAEVRIHADLMPGNLLVRDGRLAAVIDLEALAVGDPAVDLMPAWNLLGAAARAAYREALGVDDATWRRGQGWAIVQAIVALPYYAGTNPVMAATARGTLAAILDSRPPRG